MNIVKKFVVFGFNKVMGSEKHIALEKVEFRGWKTNSFDTEDEAIEALIEDGKTYEDFVILREVFIT